MALRAGAKHVTAVERWLYLSLATKQSLVANGKESWLHMVREAFTFNPATMHPLLGQHCCCACRQWFADSALP